MPPNRSTPLLLITLFALAMTACPKGVGLLPGANASNSPSAAPASGSAATATPSPSAVPVGEGTLKGDMALAFKTATSWASDAQLYEVEGLFIDHTGIRSTTGADAWNFRFAADSKPNTFYTVNVSGSNKVVGQESDGAAPFKTFQRGAIGIDSPAACRIAGATSGDVRLNVYFDERIGVLVYLFPDHERTRLDAWTGDKLSP